MEDKLTEIFDTVQKLKDDHKAKMQLNRSVVDTHMNGHSEYMNGTNGHINGMNGHLEKDPYTRYKNSKDLYPEVLPDKTSDK